jgi:hypothetical protein
VLKRPAGGSLFPAVCTNGKINFQKRFPMKKLLAATLFAVFAFCQSAGAQSLVNVASDPSVAAVRQYADQYFGKNQHSEYGRDRRHDDCDKCDKKKRKNRDKCGQRGNHYGKHKHDRGRQCDDDRPACCHCSRHDRGCDRDDDRDYDRDYGRRDDDRYGRSSRDRDDDTYRRNDQPARRNTEVRVKSRRQTPQAKPANSRVGSAKKKAPARPKMGN